MKEIFNLNQILKKENYEKEKNKIKDRILSSFKERKNECELLIQNNEVIECSLGMVLLNLMLLRPFVELKTIPDKSMLYLDNYIDPDKLEGYFNKVINLYENQDEFDYNIVRKEIMETLDEMSEISGKTNVLYGNSLSFLDFVRLAKDDPKAREIFYPEIPYGLQFDEIESRFAKAGKDALKYFAEKEDSDLHLYALSKTGLNSKQLGQCVSFVGLKPDIDGSVIPVNINTNYLRGLKNIENYFINCKGTRLALITNFKNVKKSGYLTRKLSLCMIDNFHDDNIKDCGTKHFLIYNINSDQKFDMIIGRHYYKINENNEKISEELLTVKESDKESLMNTKIGLRSPVCCCGKHVCATCYGKALSKKNCNINTGLVPVFSLTDPLTQSFLSAKHCATCC